MPCYHPRNAWRTAPLERVYMGIAPPGCEQLQVPCSSCSGCIARHALTWALRCYLENTQHTHSAWLGLTYNDEHCPPTLSVYHLQLFLKRLRHAMDQRPRWIKKMVGRPPARPLRFFASGEYGPAGGRPHYHVIAFGLSYTERQKVADAWTSRRGSMGHISIDPITTSNICYTAGYTDKKWGDRKVAQIHRVDPETGEAYQWQPPFVQMSRRPGIAAYAKQFTDSWRDYGVLDGTKTPLPRYLHEAWEAVASDQDKAALTEQRRQHALSRGTTKEQLAAMETIARVKHQQQQQRRRGDRGPR